MALIEEYEVPWPSGWRPIPAVTGLVLDMGLAHGLNLPGHVPSLSFLAVRHARGV